MDDDTTTIDMLEELESETLSFTGTLDKTRYIFDYERSLSPFHHSEIRDESGEGIGSDLWFYIGN